MSVAENREIGEIREREEITNHTAGSGRPQWPHITPAVKHCLARATVYLFSMCKAALTE